MSKLTTATALLTLALAPAAFGSVAQDYRSPDARPAVTQQDYRSPDAKPIAVRSTTAGVSDRRSPDARPSGAFQTSTPAEAAHPSSSFDWGYLIAATAIALILLTTLVMAQRRRRHGLAIGS